MGSVEMVTVRMSRGDLATPWGFQIVPPATVTKINGGSLADRAGLQNGDHIDEIQGELSPGFERALQLLRSAGHEIDLVVLRDPTVTTSHVWRPKVTIEDEPRDSSQLRVSSTEPSQTFAASPSVKVSLEHTPMQPPSVPGFNSSPHPYQPPPELNNNQPSHKPVNFPYVNRAEQYLLEKGGLFGTDPAVMKAREQPSYLQSETLKLIQEQEKNGRPRAKVPNSPDAVTSREPIGSHKLPQCFLCGRSIIGVMCRVQESVAVHPECFQCSTCGTSLRNVGHHFLNEKFYCDVHGQQRMQLGGGRAPRPGGISSAPLNPDLVVKIPPSAAQPTRVPEPPRGFYQPKILTTGPLSPSQPPQRSPIDNIARTTVYNNQVYAPESSNASNEVITPGNPNQQSTSSPSTATKEARQMSRHFAPFARSRSVRGIQWPPPPDKVQRNAEAIRYWKMPAEPADREKKSLQQLIQEDEEAGKRNVRDPSPERPKMNAKRVIATPHRLLQPMRNPLEAYVDKVRSTTDLSQGLSRAKSAASVLSLGPPPAVNVSWTDRVMSGSRSPSQLSNEAKEYSPVQATTNVRSEPEIAVPVMPSVALRSDLILEMESAEPKAEPMETWRTRSDILEEADIMTDASSIRGSENDENDDATLQLPCFDERTSQYLMTERGYDDSVSPSLDDLDRRSSTSTIKEEDDEVTQAEQERWMREEVEQARLEASLRQPETPLRSPMQQQQENGVHAEAECLHELATTPLLEDEIPATSFDPEQEINIIEKHQQKLQDQQDQLAKLLDNAIKYLKDTDTGKPTEASESQPEYENVQILKPALDPDQCDLNTPASKIIRSLKAMENGNAYQQQQQQQKTTIYEQQRLSSTSSSLPPPISTGDTQHASATSNAFTDGIRQHGQLVNQTNRVPFCEQCKAQIRGAYVLAAGMTWCPEHFVCANPACNRRLLDTGFVEEKGKKYCEKCFETLIAPICNKCGMPITADCLTALQRRWHPECFVCHHCSRPFGNSAFYLENGRPYCEQDWNMLFTTKCVSCKFPIEAGDRWVEAIGSAFHSNCFCCTICQTNLEGQSFYAKNGLPFCRIHA